MKRLIVAAGAVVGAAGLGGERSHLLRRGGLLVALAMLTGLNRSPYPVVWFKICPVLLTSSAALLVVAGPL